MGVKKGLKLVNKKQKKSVKKNKNNGKAIDPITFSVILNRFNTIAHEMTSTMERSAWSSIISISHDFSCAIYDV